MTKETEISRRTALKTMSAAGATLLTFPAMARAAEPQLTGFPLATEHARALATAMANPDFFEGWSVRIHGGDPEQSIWFGNADSIRHLIEAHREAYRQFNEHCDIEDAARSAYKTRRPLVPIYLTPDGQTPGGFHELDPDHPEETIRMIRDHHESQRRTHCGRFASAIHSAEEIKATRKTIASSERRCMKALEAALVQEEVERDASGYGAIERHHLELMEAEDAALEALCAAPCRSPAEGSTKAAYLRQFFARGNDPQERHIEALLAAMEAA